MLGTASCKGQNDLWVAPLTTKHKMESCGALGKMIFFLFESAEKGLVTPNGSWGFPGSVLGVQRGSSSLFLFLWIWSREATLTSSLPSISPKPSSLFAALRTLVSKRGRDGRGSLISGT